MTWDKNLAESNWIQLGYVAASVASVAVPLAKGSKVDLSDRDRDILRQQATFFDTAVAGWASFEEPTLMFQVPDESSAYPTSALETAAEIYSSVHGGVLADPRRFKTDMQAFSVVLKDIAEGKPVRAADVTVLNSLEGLLQAIIERARAEIHKSSRTPR